MAQDQGLNLLELDIPREAGVSWSSNDIDSLVAPLIHHHRRNLTERKAHRLQLLPAFHQH